ncbi:MAG TPA: hypothetical protein VNM16_04530 [Bacillota bacterium]|nr:hypothetical protein [Bacillota bacterium]
MDETRHLLRHLLATIAFRAGVCLREAPDGFADFQAGAGVRTPAELVRHLSGLMGFGSRILCGGERVALPDLPWQQELSRLGEVMAALDGVLATALLQSQDVDAALQGPLADALTHVGQLAMLRRLAGSPMQGANYPRAEIREGKLAL